ncbi:MAG: outer membrane beta-barrel protein [Alistipes sp.]|nr:outer membrane beta-barrel protein [Alistipes sp.]
MLGVLCLCVGAYTAVAQTADSVQQKREVFTIGGSSHRSEAQATQEESPASTQQKSHLVVGVNTFSKKANPDRHNRWLWNDGHWAGIGIHYSGLITNLTNFNLPDDAKYMSQSAKSIGVTLNPIDYTLLKSRHVGLMTGLGIEFNNFRFENDITLKQEKGVTLPDYQYIERGIRLEKSKLYTCYLNVPLLIEFTMGPRNSFFINLGVIGGWHLGTHTKIKAADPQLNGTFKDHGNFNLRNFHYGYVLGFGYGHFGISATYYRSTLFKDDRGPRVQQMNVGISLLL